MVVERTGDLEARLQALKLDVKTKAQEKGVEEKERLKDVVGIMGGKGRLGILAGVIARSSGGESGLNDPSPYLISLRPGVIDHYDSCVVSLFAYSVCAVCSAEWFQSGETTRRKPPIISSPCTLDGSRS